MAATGRAARSRQPDRLRVPGADADAVGHGFDNVLLPLKLKAPARRERATRVDGRARRVGLAEIRRGLSARIVGRHAHAGLDRARAGHRAAAAADGRAVRRARRDHALSSSTTICCELWQALRTTVVFVTHSVFESVYLSSRIVVMAARPGRVFAELAIDAPYPRDQEFRTSAEYAALCRRASDALAQAMAAGGGAMTPARRRQPRPHCLRIVLPVVVLALGIAVWELVVRLGRHSALCAARPRPDRANPDRRRTLAVQSLLVTLTPPSRALCWRPSAASASRCCSTNRGWSNTRSIPMP